MSKRLFILFLMVTILSTWVWMQPPPQPQIMAHHFIKLDDNGQPLTAWAGPWACVLDSRTGLVWENKTDDESIHDGYWTYSWYDGVQGEPNMGDCYFKPERCDVMDLIERSNANKTCGLTGWRLPDSAELLSLVDSQVKPGEPWIDQSYFPHSHKSDYWTRDHQHPLKGIYQHLGTGAKAVSFVDGQLRVLPYRNAAFVRLVTEHP